MWNWTALRPILRRRPERRRPLRRNKHSCSSLVEEHVIFGGEKKLANLIESTVELVNGELFAVISGCVPSLIGDDVGSVIRRYKEKNPNVPIIHVNTSGFAGTSYDGYEYFFDAVIDQLLEKAPKEKGLVNVSA
jgi:nitrogenase molybdenum-iron protein beta chain